MSEVSRRPIRPAAPATIRLAIVPLRIRARPRGRAAFVARIDSGVLCAFGRGGSRSGRRRRSGRRSRLAMLCGPVFFAQAAADAFFAALLEGADLVARLWHLTVTPQAVVHAAVMFRDRLAVTVRGLASSLVRHQIFSLKCVFFDYRVRNQAG